MPPAKRMDKRASVRKAIETAFSGFQRVHTLDLRYHDPLEGFSCAGQAWSSFSSTLVHLDLTVHFECDKPHLSIFSADIPHGARCPNLESFALHFVVRHRVFRLDTASTRNALQRLSAVLAESSKLRQLTLHNISPDLTEFLKPRHYPSLAVLQVYLPAPQPSVAAFIASHQASLRDLTLLQNISHETLDTSALEKLTLCTAALNRNWNHFLHQFQHNSTFLRHLDIKNSQLKIYPSGLEPEVESSALAMEPEAFNSLFSALSQAPHLETLKIWILQLSVMLMASIARNLPDLSTLCVRFQLGIVSRLWQTSFSAPRRIVPGVDHVRAIVNIMFLFLTLLLSRFGVISLTT